MHTDKDWITEQIISCAFEVSNTLGAGFLEKVYERALVKELTSRGLRCAAQVGLPVFYKGDLVGDYFVDVLVEGSVLVELKCVERLMGAHSAQCLNYLSFGEMRLFAA